MSDTKVFQKFEIQKYNCSITKQINPIKNRLKSYLHFVKEIAKMNKCISIFIFLFYRSIHVGLKIKKINV